MSHTRVLHVRAAKVALFVGTILAAINYGDRIYMGSMESSDWLKLALTYAVPYTVSFYSAYSALKSKEH